MAVRPCGGRCSGVGGGGGAREGGQLLGRGVVAHARGVVDVAADAALVVASLILQRRHQVRNAM